MNAPAAAGIEIEFAPALPLGAIAPSETPSQVRRRKRHTKEAIAEFAKNIGAIGVMEPIIVRRLAALRDLAGYELVAGERRWLAAKEAGHEHIPALIREIADDDLALFQLSENLQRETIAPLEEAEALRDLIQAKHISNEAAGELVGKSRRHVYNRLKLLTLKHPAAIEALESGRLDHTKALQIARYPSIKVQGKAFDMIGDETISMRQAAELLRDKLLVRLDAAPFRLDDDSMRNEGRVTFDCQIVKHGRDGSTVSTPPLPACTACRNCSTNDPDLQEQIVAWYGEHARACTDKPCHDFKVKTFFKQRIADARANGVPIIEAEQAHKVRASLWSEELVGYVDLDAICSEAEMPAGLSDDEGALWQAPTYRTFLGEEAIVSAVMIDPKRDGQPRELMAYADAKKALKKKGVKLGPEPVPQQESAPAHRSGATPEEVEEHQREAEAQKEREEKEMGFRRRIGALIYAKWKGKLTRADWELVAEECLQAGAGNMIANALFEGEINLSEMNERDLQALCLLAPHAQSLAWHQSSPSDMLALAKRLKIDPAKVRKEKKEAADQAEKPAAKKKGKRK